MIKTIQRLKIFLFKLFKFFVFHLYEKEMNEIIENKCPN